MNELLNYLLWFSMLFSLGTSGALARTNSLSAAPVGVVSIILRADTIVVAEGFSPNNDGINDTFTVRYAGPEPIQLEVFNRWGQQVYFNEDYRNDWNGASNQGLFRTSQPNDVLPDGTYYYIVRAGTSRRVGSLTLLR